MQRSLFLMPFLFAACTSGNSDDMTGDDDDTVAIDPCVPNDAPTLEIGEGLKGFVPLDNGDPLLLIHGPQGGYHLEIGLFATGMAADELVSGKLYGYIDDEEYAYAAPRLDLRCVGDGQESFGTLLVYNSTPDFLDGKTTRITVEVTGTDGNVVTAEGTYLIEDSAPLE